MSSVSSYIFFFSEESCEVYTNGCKSGTDRRLVLIYRRLVPIYPYHILYYSFRALINNIFNNQLNAQYVYNYYLY